MLPFRFLFSLSLCFRSRSFYFQLGSFAFLSFPFNSIFRFPSPFPSFSQVSRLLFYLFIFCSPFPFLFVSLPFISSWLLLRFPFSSVFRFPSPFPVFSQVSRLPFYLFIFCSPFPFLFVSLPFISSWLLLRFPFSSVFRFPSPFPVFSQVSRLLFYLFVFCSPFPVLSFWPPFFGDMGRSIGPGRPCVLHWTSWRKILLFHWANTQEANCASACRRLWGAKLGDLFARPKHDRSQSLDKPAIFPERAGK